MAIAYHRHQPFLILHYSYFPETTLVTPTHPVGIYSPRVFPPLTKSPKTAPDRYTVVRRPLQK